MFLRLFGGICLFGFLSAPALYAQKVHEIRFASIAPPNTTPDRIIKSLSEELRMLSDGRLRIKNYANSQGDESDIIRKLNPRLARLHVAGMTGRGLGEILPMIRVLELPFLFRDYDEVDYVTEKLYDRFAEELEQRGFILLGWAEVGFVYMFSKDKVVTQEDLQKVKMWTWSGDPLARELFDALNVTPVPLALPDALTSLQTGLINAVYAHPYGALALSWHERTNYMSLLPVTYATGAVLVTKSKFDELEPGLQELLMMTSAKWFSELVKQTRKDNEDSLNLLQSNSIEFIPKPEGADLEVFIDAGQRVRDKLSGNLYPIELLEEVLVLLEEFRNN